MAQAEKKNPRVSIGCKWKGQFRKTYKSVNLPTDVDENPDLGSSFLLALHCKRCQDRGLHLIAKTGDGSTDAGGDVPRCGMLQLEPPS